MMFGLASPSRQPCVSRPGWAPVSRNEHCRSHLRSEERSQDLLRQWLSPDQAKQYDKYQRFEVVGSDTGTRYRILRGTTMNIEELAADGYVTQRWCFAPRSQAERKLLASSELENLLMKARRRHCNRWVYVDACTAAGAQDGVRVLAPAAVQAST
jgi:hypothetical protein